MLRYVELLDVGPTKAMRVDFSPGLNFLTGDNGLGKTFVLDVAWWTLARHWADAKALPDPERGDKPRINFEFYEQKRSEPFEARYSFERELWSLPEKRWMEPVAVLYIRADGGICVYDPLKGHKPFIFKPEQIWSGLTWGAKQVCNGLIRDWVSWQLRQDEKRENFEMLADVLEALSPSDHEKIKTGDPLRTSLKESQEVPTIKLPYGRVPVTHASAGIRRILSIAYMLVWMWSENREAEKLSRRESSNRFVVLFDEVESHLHPQWQRRLIPALLKVLKRLNPKAEIQFIASTHAPLVLASVETIFNDETDCLINFQLKGKHVEVEPIPWSKQGDVVNWLVSESFGLLQARSPEAEKAIEAAEAYMRGDKDFKYGKLKAKETIHKELQRVLPGHDEFWPRWIVTVEEKQ
jgi:hypothetical protein